ncbi:hypothetical protein SAMN05421818_103126 [Myroides phaeus]|uniref:Uncharacterized protein n=2 Tax=Myroides phaeus TaxID=702745 RepID=A0A1G8C4S3_9FLAO|nr:hypothetical protein SAMN05421818_103126 [Myroides phaeus]
MRHAKKTVMDKIDEKIIAIQTSINMDLLGNLVIQLRNNPQKTLINFVEDWQKSIRWDKAENYSIINQGVDSYPSLWTYYLS